MGKNYGLGSLLAMSFLVLLMPLPVYGVDMLVVKDLGGVNTEFVVTDTGSVGIGTATPQSSLHLVDNSTSGSRGFITGQHNDGAQAGVIVLRKSRGTETSPAAVVSGDYIATIHAQAYDGTQYLSNISTGSISFFVDGTVATGVIPTGMSFQTGTTPTNKTERLRITSSGYVGIGTAAPTHLIQLSGGAYSTGTTWVNASSREYKENIRELTTSEAIDALVRLDPVKYNYKVDKEDRHVGFIAEDVPDLVATKDRKGLSPMDIVAVLTKVVQEQQKTIAGLKGEMAELKKTANSSTREKAPQETKVLTGSKVF